VRLLPGARELLAHLSAVGVPWAIATSGRMEAARAALDLLGVACDAVIITRDQVSHAKPDPDLFLDCTWTSPSQSWSATASGICWRRAARGRWMWACFRVAMAKTSSNGRARTACTPTRPICSVTLTRSGCAH
jgi:hypothetical protein